MARASSITDRRAALMCLDCGYDGPELQPDARALTFICPACECDLYARPARSYAQMEGLVPSDGSASHRWDRPARRPDDRAPVERPSATRRWSAARWLAIAACASVIASSALVAALLRASIG